MDTNLFQRIEELERKLAQMHVRGKVVEVDYENQRARVQYGENQTTGWLRWKPLRAGRAIVWWPLEVGEAVTVLSPGDLTLGEILPSSYSEAHSAPSTNPDLCIVQFGDGSYVQHDRSNGNYTANYVGDSVITIGKNATINTTENTTINTDGDTTINSVGKVNINSTEAKLIELNGGGGVVTSECVCPFTGSPHSDFSTQVKAAK